MARPLGRRCNIMKTVSPVDQSSFLFKTSDNVANEIVRFSNRVKEATAEDSLVIPFITDTHLALLPKNLKNLKKASFEHIDNFVNVCNLIDHDLVVQNGDLNDGSSLDVEDFWAANQSYKRKMKSIIKPIVNVRGNHDDNSLADRYADNNLKKVATYKETKKFFFDDYFTKGSLITDKSDKMYGYIDTKGVRIIFIDLFDSRQEVGSDGKTKFPLVSSGGCIQQTQVDWLIDTLKNTPATHSVLFIAHTAPSDVYDVANTINTDVVSLIIKAYQHGSSYNFSGTNKDFPLEIEGAFSGKRKIIAFVHGHRHRDEVTVIKGTDVKCIGLLCSKTEPNASYTFRDFGTRYEDSFNVLLIDKGDIKILRFGAGGDINV